MRRSPNPGLHIPNPPSYLCLKFSAARICIHRVSREECESLTVTHSCDFMNYFADLGYLFVVFERRDFRNKNACNPAILELVISCGVTRPSGIIRQGGRYKIRAQRRKLMSKINRNRRSFNLDTSRPYFFGDIERPSRSERNCNSGEGVIMRQMQLVTPVRVSKRRRRNTFNYVQRRFFAN